MQTQSTVGEAYTQRLVSKALREKCRALSAHPFFVDKKSNGQTKKRSSKKLHEKLASKVAK